MRSPFVGGGDDEMAARARLDARLRRSAPARLALGKLIGLVEACPGLRQVLERIYSVSRLESASPHEWGEHFTQLLDAAGFPGRGLDSAEYQTRAKFNQTLAELARLERVAPRMNAARALSRLERLCRDTLFQPETPEAPLQVLGVLESAGLAFDALWLAGMTDEAWPLAARPNPFLPPALQKKAGIPEASAEQTLARGKRITEGWLAAAPEVVVSHPAWEDDRKLVVSPLVSAITDLAGPRVDRTALARPDLRRARRRSRRPTEARRRWRRKPRAAAPAFSPTRPRARFAPSRATGSAPRRWRSRSRGPTRARAARCCTR